MPDKKIKELLQTEKPDVVIEFVKTNHKEDKLKPSTLADLFLAYVSVVGWEDEEKGISPLIEMTDLCQINSWFKSTNGCQWARSDNSQLGKVYTIERQLKGGSVSAIKLTGFNDSDKRNRSIRKDIVDAISKQRCVVLDVGVQIEVDHKNGRYDEERVANKETQQLDDFQPLHKSVNDAKRHHCKECIENHKRYNAQRLGYKEGWISGDETDTICKGCYWYDPKIFNQTISKDFKKT